MNESPETAPEPPVSAAAATVRGDGIGATIGKAVVTGVAIWGTYRFLDYVFAKPPEPIYLVLEKPAPCASEEEEDA